MVIPTIQNHPLAVNSLAARVTRDFRAFSASSSPRHLVS